MKILLYALLLSLLSTVAYGMMGSSPLPEMLRYEVYYDFYCAQDGPMCSCIQAIFRCATFCCAASAHTISSSASTDPDPDDDFQ